MKAIGDRLEAMPAALPLEARENRIISKTVPRHKEMKEQLQFEGLSDTSQQHNPGKAKEHWATASRKGKFFLVISGTFQQWIWKGWWQKSFTSLPQQQGGWLQINQEIKGSHPLGSTKEEIICQKPLVPKSFLTSRCLGVIAIQILGVSTKECWRREQEGKRGCKSSS